ncbi:MAG: 3'(2'),5'-bisphosphate nucleotidase CysQ, partial [Actinobacteria bacterium]|nr:3'(2'),5'-bisphosphate nucleotidase CysQ [Actinomycetota bacterium]
MASDADHRLAGDLAAQAGAVLVELRSRLQAEGVDPSIIGDRGDALAHELIVGRLGVERPGDFVLSEESSDDERSDRSRLGADRVWIVDPLDGTREFREGRSDWAVHVALVEDGSPTAGAVALPAFGVLDATDPSASTAPTAARGTSASPHRTRVVLSRSRPSALATSVAASLGATVEPMGSAGAKAMAVLHGDADVYLSPGALNEWDACAPVAVALAAGL